jgi:hypothetical protein
MTPTASPAARHCGSVSGHPPGLDRNWANDIQSFRVSCPKARAIVRGWLGRRASYVATTSRYRGFRWIFRDPEDYLGTRGGTWIIFELSSIRED